MTKFLISLALAAVAPMSPALAGTATDRVEVRTDDLDLASAAGNTAMDRRIRQGVDTVCGSPLDDRIAAVAIERCRATAFSDAQRQREVAVARSPVRPAPLAAR